MFVPVQRSIVTGYIFDIRNEYSLYFLWESAGSDGDGTANIVNVTWRCCQRSETGPAVSVMWRACSVRQMKEMPASLPRPSTLPISLKLGPLPAPPDCRGVSELLRSSFIVWLFCPSCRHLSARGCIGSDVSAVGEDVFHTLIPNMENKVHTLTPNRT